VLAVIKRWLNGRKMLQQVALLLCRGSIKHMQVVVMPYHVLESLGHARNGHLRSELLLEVRN
jgi:hypothetical protein